MRILFIHQNFPGQFKHLAPALASQAGIDVAALVLQMEVPPTWNGVKLFAYQVERSSTPQIHPWAGDFETKAIRAEAAMLAALALRDQGYIPDLIVAHPGWGESLFLKEVWPQAKLAIYCEYFYRMQDSDANFDPEFASADRTYAAWVQVRNINLLMHFPVSDAGIAPTQWQANLFPEVFRNKITVVHDGVDCELLAPDVSVALKLNGELTVTRDDEIITFVNRNMEPQRGYHVFMRALPELLRRRPEARILIVGGDEAGYGAKAPDGKSWKQIFLDEIRPQLGDEAFARIHFVGRVSHEVFVALLQLSTVHVYLTYPFVLSWSLLEAMSVGCAIVASDTAPVREAISHDDTGVLVDFFDIAGLTKAIIALLDDPARRARLGAAARTFALENYDLNTVCLPRQLAWVQSLMESANGQ